MTALNEATLTARIEALFGCPRDEAKAAAIYLIERDKPEEHNLRFDHRSTAAQDRILAETLRASLVPAITGDSSHEVMKRWTPPRLATWMKHRRACFAAVERAQDVIAATKRGREVRA